MPPLHLPSELGLLERHVEHVVPRVSVMPEVSARVRRAFGHVLMHAMAMTGAQMNAAAPGSSPRKRIVVATLSAVASSEGLNADEVPALRAWLRRWVQALDIGTVCNDEQFHFRAATLAPSVRSGGRSATELMTAPVSEQAEELFDGLVYGQEVLHAPAAPQARPSTTAPAPSAGPVGRFLPPDESVGYEDRLRLMHEKGGSRALAARYTVEYLRLDPQILQPEPSIEPQGRIDDSRTKKRSRDASLAA